MKYYITNKFIYHENKKLFRIRAIKSFYNSNSDTYIKKGELGGYIESTKNLSQKGNCWVVELAKVYDRARIRNNAIVLGTTTVSDEA